MKTIEEEENLPCGLALFSLKKFVEFTEIDSEMTNGDFTNNFIY
jgi:hypothetical protein